MNMYSKPRMPSLNSTSNHFTQSTIIVYKLKLYMERGRPANVKKCDAEGYGERSYVGRDGMDVLTIST